MYQRLSPPGRAWVPGHEKNHASENRKRGVIGAILLTNRPSTLILWVKDDFSDEGSEVPVRFSSNEGLRVPAAQPSCERSFFHLCSELYHNFTLQSSALFFWSGQRPGKPASGRSWFCPFMVDKTACRRWCQTPTRPLEAAGSRWRPRSEKA